MFGCPRGRVAQTRGVFLRAISHVFAGRFQPLAGYEPDPSGSGGMNVLEDEQQRSQEAAAEETAVLPARDPPREPDGRPVDPHVRRVAIISPSLKSTAFRF